MISHSAWNPEGPISFNDTSKNVNLVDSLKLSASDIIPSSPIIFPFILRLSKLWFFEIPFASHLHPYTPSSLNSIDNF